MELECGRRSFIGFADPLTLVVETSMTPTFEDHERRITVLEERMDQQAGLRASQDRDLAAIAESVRAQGRLIQALAVTQSEHTQALAQLTEAMDEVKGSIDEIKGGVTQIVGMVGTLIERDERH